MRDAAGGARGTLGGATRTGVIGTLGDAARMGSFERCTGAEEGGATARPRIAATFAKALSIGGPKEKGADTVETVDDLRRCNMSSAVSCELFPRLCEYWLPGDSELLQHELNWLHDDTRRKRNGCRD